MGASVWPRKDEPGPRTKTFRLAGSRGFQRPTWRNASAGMCTICSRLAAAPNAIVGAFDSSWNLLSTSDYNGDSKVDIIWRNAAGTFTQWQSTHTGFRPRPRGPVTTNWTLLPTKPTQPAGST